MKLKCRSDSYLGYCGCPVLVQGLDCDSSLRGSDSRQSPYCLIGAYFLMTVCKTVVHNYVRWSDKRFNSSCAHWYCRLSVGPLKMCDIDSCNNKGFVKCSWSTPHISQDAVLCEACLHTLYTMLNPYLQLATGWIILEKVEGNKWDSYCF